MSVSKGSSDEALLLLPNCNICCHHTVSSWCLTWSLSRNHLIHHLQYVESRLNDFCHHWSTVVDIWLIFPSIQCWSIKQSLPKTMVDVCKKSTLVLGAYKILSISYGRSQLCIMPQLCCLLLISVSTVLCQVVLSDFSFSVPQVFLTL